MQLSPEQFHTLFDRAAQPVLLVQDGVITQCSSRAEGLIAPGSPIRELLPPDAVLQELIAAAPMVLPLRLRTGYVTAQVQPLEGALLLFLPAGDDDACTSALSRAAQAVSAPLTTLLSASGTIFPLLADVEDPVLHSSFNLNSIVFVPFFIRSNGPLFNFISCFILFTSLTIFSLSLFPFLHDNLFYYKNSYQYHCRRIHQLLHIHIQRI